MEPTYIFFLRGRLTEVLRDVFRSPGMSLMRILYLRIRGLMQGNVFECSHVAYSIGQSFHLTKQNTLLLISLRSRTSSTWQKGSAASCCIYNNIWRQYSSNNYLLYRQIMAYRDPYIPYGQDYHQEDPSLNLYRPSNTYVPTQPRIDHSPQQRWQPDTSQGRGSYQVQAGKKSEIKNRIREIIDLCKGENAAIHQEMAGVIRDEREVYDLLARTEQDNFRPPASSAPIHSQFTPHREEQGSTLQRDIKSILVQNSHIQLPEQALQLVNQIQRRALAEIQKVKAQLAHQRRRNGELEKELSYYRSQGAPGGGYEAELKAKVAYLQGLLNSKGSSGIDFNALYAQGEAIRQQTLRLLKLKEARMGGSDDEEKRRLREEVDRLQRRIGSLQSERGGRPSKPSYQVINEQYSPIAPAYKRSNSNRNSANEYESLVMEMRKITNN